MQVFFPGDTNKALLNWWPILVRQRNMYYGAVSLEDLSNLVTPK